jgi:hypothetical protein
MIARAGRSPWAPVSYARAVRLAVGLLEKDAATARERLAGLKKKNEEVQSAEYEAQMRAHLEKYSGEFRTTNPAKWQGRVAGMERELKYNREKAARDANPQRDKEGLWYWTPVDALAEGKKRVGELQPGDETAAACYVEWKGEAAQGRYAMRGEIRRLGGDGGCEAVVTDHYGYFEARAPRTEPQILIIRGVGLCLKYINGAFRRTFPVVAGQVAHGCAFHPDYFEQMDWGRLAGLVRR